MIGALSFQIIHIGISDSLSSQSSRTYVGAGEFVFRSDEMDLNKYTTPGTYYLNLFMSGFANTPYTETFALIEVRKYNNIVFQRISSDKGVLSRMGEIDRLPSWPR